MSKRILVVALAAAFIVCGAAFAEVRSVKVSGDVTAQAISRDMSLGSPLARDKEQFLLSQTRLKVSADLVENVSSTVQLINERAWGVEDVANTDIDLDQAYVELKEFFVQPLTLVVGRQPLKYGNGLVIGDPDTNCNASASVPLAIKDLSLRKSFDAVKGVVNLAPFTIDLVYAKVAEGDTNKNDDVSLFGANIAYEWSNNYGVSELYIFGADSASSNLVTGLVEDRKNYVYTAGGRVMTPLSEHFIVSLEGAFQFGDYRQYTTGLHTRLNAWAMQSALVYRFVDKGDTNIKLSYTWLSGDDPSSKHNEAWDPMFSDQVCSELISKIKANSNAFNLRLEITTMPREDLLLGLVFVDQMLAEKLPSATSRAEGLVTRYPGIYLPAYGPLSGNYYFINNVSRHLGDEVNAYAVYDYTEDVKLKVTGAYFMPGKLLAERNNSAGYSVRTGLSVDF